MATSSWLTSIESFFLNLFHAEMPVAIQAAEQAASDVPAILAASKPLVAAAQMMNTIAQNNEQAAIGAGLNAITVAVVNKVTALGQTAGAAPPTQVAPTPPAAA